MKEMIKDFYGTIHKLEGKSHIDYYLKYTLAPVREGLKPSMTVAFTKAKGLDEKWSQYGKELVEGMGLTFCILRHSIFTKIILIYDKEHMTRIINQKDNYLFLKQLGYPIEKGVEKAVACLQERYQIYHCPHELGIFLGIPLDDVKDFMACTTKQCKICGYWKVYNDLELAVKTFKAYDRAKEKTLKVLLSDLKRVG